MYVQYQLIILASYDARASIVGPLLLRLLLFFCERGGLWHFVWYPGQISMVKSQRSCQGVAKP